MSEALRATRTAEYLPSSALFRTRQIRRVPLIGTLSFPCKVEGKFNPERYLVEQKCKYLY